ncbi:MAG TPA: Spy/CpxP family protein refolding chaperone [Azospirillum sp.]|nr:Spy/CpxP family protein refolding chaperone [Azospirillum sp.]
MLFLTRTILPALALAALMSAVQGGAAVAEDNHHPEGAAAPTQAQPAPQAAPAPMIGQPLGSGAFVQPSGQPDMTTGGMMPMMRPMMGPSGGMGMPFEHLEGRIAFLKAELKITDAQAPQWTAFADALRTSAKAHQGMVERSSKASAPATWLDRLALQQTALSVRLESLKALETAAKPLYAALTAEQKILADRLFAGPMGVM